MTLSKYQFTSEDTKIIAKNLRDIRHSFGISQQEIGDILDVTFQQVQKYENGSNRLSMEKLFILKSFYGLPYEAFFRGLTIKACKNSGPEAIQEYVCMLLERCGEAERYRMLEVLCVLSK